MSFQLTTSCFLASAAAANLSLDCCLTLTGGALFLSVEADLEAGLEATAAVAAKVSLRTFSASAFLVLSRITSC